MTRIIVLDVETTGKDRARDQIIELCLQLGLRGNAGDGEVRTWRFKPTVPINPEATQVHGITDADLANSPTFADCANEVISYINGADVLVGYNVAFDLDMLQAELARAGRPPLDLDTPRIVDVLRLWQHVEPRTLAAAHAKFCGAELTDAHRADADVAATGRVLAAMLAAFDLTSKSWPELATIADPFTTRANWIGPSHHIQWDADGNAVFGFGKNQNRRVDQTDPGFLRWVLSKDFPPHVKDICAAAIQLPGVHLKPWIAERYPRRAATTTEAA